MEMDKKAVKEWKAEYELINAAEREMLKQELPLILPGEGAMRYFRLCESLRTQIIESREIFADQRRERYRALEARLRKIAEYQRHGFSS